MHHQERKTGSDNSPFSLVSRPYSATLSQMTEERLGSLVDEQVRVHVGNFDPDRFSREVVARVKEEVSTLLSDRMYLGREPVSYDEGGFPGPTSEPFVDAP